MSGLEGGLTTRLTLFAILSAIEEDLRSAILSNLGPRADAAAILGPELWDVTSKRMSRGVDVVGEPDSLAERVPFLDFAHAYEVINANKHQLPTGLAQYYNSAAKTLEPLLPIRNRVMHGRPLELEDLANTVDIAKPLAGESNGQWEILRGRLKRMEADPGFVLALSIPAPWDDVECANHNLPFPDFDETGWIGRKKEERDLLRLCTSPEWPVLTVLGLGGVGKTALAVKVAYEIVDSPTCPFDAVVWSTAKDARLTAYEIQRIPGAISDSLGMCQDVAGWLAGSAAGDPLEEIVSYIRAFRILLILDNLETIVDDRIREIATEFSGGSKLVMTSRIGLGANERVVPLGRLARAESVHLVRTLARVRSVRSLVEMPMFELESVCKRLEDNPLFLKAFVSAVENGARPEDALRHPDRKTIYDFAMSNVYGQLSVKERSVLESMVCVRGPQTIAILSYLNDSNATTIQEVTQRLLRTHMVKVTSVRVDGSLETAYELDDLSRAYLSQHHPPDSNRFQRLTALSRELDKAMHRFASSRKANPFSFYTIHVRSAGDLLVSRHLKEAVRMLEDEDFEGATSEIARARQLSPGYFEVDRVEALLRVRRRDFFGARESYEAAIAAVPTHPPLRLWYGKFLSWYLKDYRGALEQFEAGRRLESDPLTFDVEQVRTQLLLDEPDHARPILEELLARIRASGPVGYAGRERHSRDIHTLDLRWWIMRAQKSHEPQALLESLEGAKAAFERCPKSVVDGTMRSLLQDLVPLAQHAAVDGQGAARAQQMARWFQATAAR